MSRLRPWRRIGAVLECRLDLHFALRRTHHPPAEETPALPRMAAEEVLGMLAIPEPEARDE